MGSSEFSASPRSRGRARNRPRPWQPTELDLELLRFAAEHRFVLPAQAGAVLGITPRRASHRMRALGEHGLLQRRARLFHAQPTPHLITAAGLRAAGSPLPVPTMNVGQYLHDIGLAWLWLDARRGRLGAVAEVLSERKMRHLDGIRMHDLTAGSQRYGVRLWDFRPNGAEALHYPDLRLRTASGRHVAVELELSRKHTGRLATIMEGYAADRSIDAVVYLVEGQARERAVRQMAAAAGVSGRVHVQQFTWAPSLQRLAAQLAPVATRGSATVAARSSASGRSGARNGAEVAA
jgi:hypothetical protein